MFEDNPVPTTDEMNWRVRGFLHYCAPGAEVAINAKHDGFDSLFSPDDSDGDYPDDSGGAVEMEIDD